MKQIEATKQRPFYAVSYQYAANPWTLWSFNRYFELLGDTRTMPGTDDLELAKRAANHCVTQPGIAYAQVSKTEDCYNHKTVFEVKA